jgi:hypothetical protein
MGLLTTIRDRETPLVFAENFSGARRTVVQVLRAHFSWGFWEKASLLWCFDGEVVVECVANVVSKMALTQSRKRATFCKFIFGFCFESFGLSLLRVADALVDD